MSHVISNIVGGAGSEAAGITYPGSTPIGMTPEQQAALEQQRQALSDQRTQLLQVLKDQNLLQPQLLASLGFTKDANGNYTDTSQLGKLQNQQVQDVFNADPEQQQLNSLFRQRQIQALNGDAQADPELERNLGLQEQTLRNQLQAQLGPGYETSSAGIQALNDFRQRAESLRFQSRQGIITNYSQAGSTNAGTQATLSGIPGITAGINDKRLGDVINASNITAPTTAAFTNNAAGDSNLAGAYFNQTQLGTNAQLTQEQTRGKTGTSLFGSIMGIV